MSDQMLRAFREDAESAIVRADFDEIARRGARRRLRRRAVSAISAAAVVAAVGSLALLTDGYTPSLTPTDDPAGSSLPLLVDVDGQIPPGRGAFPPIANGPSVVVLSTEIPADGVWQKSSAFSDIYAKIRSGNAYLHLSTYVVDGVARRACRALYVQPEGKAPGFVGPGSTPADVAGAITRIPRATVLEAPQPVTKWGTAAVHVRLQVRQTGCRNGKEFWIFDTAQGGESIGNVHAVLDFWVLEVDGQVFVIEAEVPVGATAAERGQLAELVDSIRFHRD
jgi:hypothetical protein